MNVFFLVASMLSAPVTYQAIAFQNEGIDGGGDTGRLDPAELTCVSDKITAFHPSESATDVLWLDVVRRDSNRSQVCLRWQVERTESIDKFITREKDPEGLRFSADGTTATFREALPVACVPRGQVATLLNCLSDYGVSPATSTQIVMRRQSTSDPMVLVSAWEVLTGDAKDYAVARRDRVARSHVREFLPEPDLAP